MITLVHGVPEIAAVRGKLRATLPSGAVALRMPGFGCPRPPGIAATPEGGLPGVARERVGAAEGNRPA